jgi:hypothetical protein
MEIAKVFCVAGLLCFAVIQSADADFFNRQDTSLDVDRWVGEWVQMWNSYDLDQVDALFLQDDRLTYFSSEKEGVIIGIKAVRDHHEGFGFVSGGKDQPNKLWVEDINSAVFESAVVVTGIWFFQRPDGSIQRGPVTIFYVRQGDRLLIAHMNFSSYDDGEK